MVVSASTGSADVIPYDLRGYTAAPGLSAVVEQGNLVVTWNGAGGTELRALYGVDRAQPVIRELAVRRSGGQWLPIGRNLVPDFKAHTARRRIDSIALRSLAAQGVDITNREVIERESWYAFWDAPFVIPGEDRLIVDWPRKPEEIQRVQGTFNTTSAEVKTDGARIEVNFPGLSMGIFSGGIRFTHYRGTNLLRVEAIAKTEQNLVAYKYDAGLKGLSTEMLPRVYWLDTGGNPQSYRFGGALHEAPVAVRAKNRVIIAEGRSGSIAAFPPPTVFFHARETDANLGYVWYRKDGQADYGIGVKQAEREDEARWLQNYALYDAPPGTWQRMAVYFYISPDSAPDTRAAAMAFTHNDTFKPVPGYKTMVNHFHLAFVDRLRESGSLDMELPDLAAFRALGLNIIGLSEFHRDRLRHQDSGDGRFTDQRDYFEASRRASDHDFLVLPWEEPSVHFGGHYNYMTPRPLYFTRGRAEGQPAVAENPQFGKVYHTGNVEDMQRMTEAEGAYWYAAHPRSKSSSGYPDAYFDKPWAQSDHNLGIAFKQGMGMDLSQPRLAEWRTFDAIDTWNNLLADTKFRPKYLIGDVDTYQKWPHDDIFPSLPVNYIKLDKLPGPDDDWAPILKALRDGEFFVTNGEVHINHYAVEGTGNRRTITADVEWTFPLEFVEVVWGDGKTVDRQIIRATDLPPFGTKRFSIPFDATGKKWVRFAVWDSAVNGAFVPPVWLHR